MVATAAHTSPVRGFHEGELLVQQRSGVGLEVRRLERMLDLPDLSGGAERFLADRTFAVLTGRGADGRLWTSPLRGPAEFLQGSGRTLRIATTPVEGDPLHSIAVGEQVALVAIEFAARRRVRVNGRVVRDAEFPVRLGVDGIDFDGRPVVQAARVVVMLNKPRGLVTTTRDERDRETVYRCLADASLPWLAPVGRLDKSSEGLLLFSNDLGLGGNNGLTGFTSIAGLPLAYTQGFHPGPKIQIASALPLGFSGRAEIADVWLQDDVGTTFMVTQDEHKGRAYAEVLQPAAPSGLTILSVEQVDEHGPALQRVPGLRVEGFERVRRHVPL